MVSKQWFNETVKIFANCTIFTSTSFATMSNIVCGLPTYLQLNITTFRVAMGSGWNGWARLAQKLRVNFSLSRALPNLKCLYISGCIYAYYVPQQLYLDHTFTAREFEDSEWIRYMPWVQPVRCLRGLKQFAFVDHDLDPVGGRLDLSTPRGKIILQNVTTLEEWIRAEVTKPKGT